MHTGIMSKWRPIKTAPKDKLILLAQPPHNYGEYPWVVMQGRWIDIPHSNEVHKCLLDGTPIPKAPVHPHWAGTYDGIMQNHGDRCDGVLSYEARSLVMYPTHWMPLPEPPKGKYKQPPGEW
jgi:hypothetical protein